MGLQDKPDSKRMPGWYTGYVRDIYGKKKGNIEKIEKSANHLLISVFNISGSSDEASWFFSTKFISSWTEGSFQSIWNGPSKDKFQPLWNRFATIYHDGTLHLFFVTYGKAVSSPPILVVCSTMLSLINEWEMEQH